MNTRSIKTAIIILLAAANIFLIYNIAALNLRAQNIPADMIENAAAILKERGIDADAKRIPAGKPARYIYEGALTEHDEIVKSFTGASDEEIINGWYTVRVPERDRAFFHIFNVGEYKFTFEDDMQIEIVKSDYRDGVTPAEIEMLAGYNNFSRSDISGAEQIIKEFLGKYPEQDIRTGFKIKGFKKEDGSDMLLVNQTVDGLFIASHAAYIIISGGEVKYFSGRWYFGAFAERYEMPLLDSVNILFKSLEHDGEALAGARLEDMRQEYNILKIDMFYFRPSWVIDFDGGRSFSYDMMTGIKNN